LEKDNFDRKSLKVKKNLEYAQYNVKLCKVKIEKRFEHKKSRKIKITLSSLECSISLGEDLN
jgi:hypothetical protein